MLERSRYPEVGKDDEEHKDVIDRESLLDQVASEELQSGSGPEPQVDPEVKQESHADPNAGPEEGFAHAHLVGSAMEDAEVQDQHGHHECGEPDPQNRGADAF